MTNQNRIKNLQAQISRHVGLPVEITIRGERAFTFSTETVEPDLEARIRAFFGQTFALTTEHDPECGSFCYAELRPICPEPAPRRAPTVDQMLHSALARA